ncbi:DNA-J related domain-containing protein [Rheinheimera baltica]|uniref:DNA-J related domain-containing protein n=1 Tax=Rheinheimera baltica TaxID=67576 RepID=UPI00041D4AAF|nr:DNA-J related domain-containing protein [Rheinheimera baltica]MDP5143252.1 DnaJ domain-containing protein [Rheinheimera baltica]MDP5149994.1 DnaJ domain-containing protein [Rheinheimera baltica]MDP5191054.1 DnaJ domain-containing protein [Rheinheimera baltica]
MTTQPAPLAEPILSLLEGQLLSIILAYTPADHVIEEHYLLRRLGLKLQTEMAVSEDLARFQQHFVLYHLLYRIQRQLLAQQQGFLNIGLAKVQFLAITQAPQQHSDIGRRDYYLDWYNFYSMTEQLLEQQLEAFWQYVDTRQTTLNNVPEQHARSLLDLPKDFSLIQLKKAYRVKALLLHPDRGGDQQQFILLRQAYQQLLLLF